MIRLRVLIIVIVLAAAPRASACRWFGTQLKCDLWVSRVVIGTQAAGERSYGTSLRPQPFQGADRLLDLRAAPGLPIEVELQDVGRDPSLCRKIGNETYCY